MSSSIPTVAEKRFSESERQFFYNMGAAATFACEKSTCTVRDYIYIYMYRRGKCTVFLSYFLGLEESTNNAKYMTICLIEINYKAKSDVKINYFLKLYFPLFFCVFPLQKEE